MARNDSQSPTPSAGGEGTDLQSVARQVEGLLDDDGHFNPSADQVSRGHPDYDESSDERAATPERDERGRFKKTAAPEDQADDTGDEVQQAVSDDLTEDTEEFSDTNEDAPESATEEARTDEEETGAIETLAEFAEALEVPLDDLKAAVTHTFNAAGEEVTVTLAELEKGYQKDADYRRSTAKLAEERKAVEAQFIQRYQAYEAQNHNLAAVLQMAENVVAAELNDPQFAELRDSDPAEWTARREEIGTRLNTLRNTRVQAAQAFDQFRMQNLAEMRQREEAALLDKLPDFGKPQRTTARETMAEMGFSEHEISEIMDHRLVLGVLELADLRKEVAELRDLKQRAGDTVKRVKKDIPKIQKPGKQRRTSNAALQRDNLAKLRGRAAKSGRVEDAAKVIEQLI